MKRVRAPKTFKELLKKCYNPDLSINEKYMEEMSKTNDITDLDEDDDFWMNAFDVETMKDILWVEKDYNKEVSGREQFYPFFYYNEDAAEGFATYYYRKKAKKIPKNTWSGATKCLGYRISYDLLCQYVKENVYIIEKKEKNIIQNDNIKSRSEILEIED